MNQDLAARSCASRRRSYSRSIKFTSSYVTCDMAKLLQINWLLRRAVPAGLQVAPAPLAARSSRQFLAAEIQAESGAATLAQCRPVERAPCAPACELCWRSHPALV